jgi:hypothetical protein
MAAAEIILNTRAQIEKASLEDLLGYALFTTDLNKSITDTITNKIDELKKDFTLRIEHAEREFEDKLRVVEKSFSDRLEIMGDELTIVKQESATFQEKLKTSTEAVQLQKIELERDIHRTAEYTQYETLEFAGIPLTIPNNEVQDLIIKIIHALGCNKVSHSDIQACHRRAGRHKTTVLCKFVWRGHAQLTWSNRLLLKDKDMTSLHPELTDPVFVNESLSPYYMKLRFVAKLMKNDKILASFWVSGHKVKVVVKEGEDFVQISHITDFRRILPGRNLDKYFVYFK